MARSDFCYSPPGQYHGDSDRYLPAVLYGCIPIFPKDGEALPYDEVLPWANASLRVGLGDVASLHTIIAAVSPARLLQMRRKLGTIWRRLLWTSIFTGASCASGAGGSCVLAWERPGQPQRSLPPRYLGEDPSQDAFATFVEVLRARLKTSER